jgi:hypothetical protein
LSYVTKYNIDVYETNTCNALNYLSEPNINVFDDGGVCVCVCVREIWLILMKSIQYRIVVFKWYGCEWVWGKVQDDWTMIMALFWDV